MSDRRATDRAALPVPPSGQQIELRHGDQHAVIVEIGGALRSYAVGGEELLDGGVQAPGPTHMPSDARGLPTGREPVAGTPLDFLTPRTLGDIELDTSFGDLRRDDDGCARVHLSTPDAQRSITLWVDLTYPYLMLFTGDSLPEPERRRRGLGVEPMTCAPNALQSGDGVRILAPGESMTSAWGIAPGARASTSKARHP